MTYARIANGVVQEVFTPPAGIALAECFTAAVAAQFVTVPPGVTPAPGWTYNGTVFAPPPAPTPPTLAQQAQALLGGTLAITSTGTSALDASYAIDPGTQDHINSEMLCVQVTGAFADGSSTVAWPDASGTLHNFTVAQFKAFALAVASFVAACYKVINGSSTTLPPATATIA